MDSHLPAELKVRKVFEKRKGYKLVNKASGADFDCVVLIHAAAAQGLALAREGLTKEAQSRLNI